MEQGRIVHRRIGTTRPLAAILAGAVLLSAATGAPAAERTIDFARDVHPILHARCLSCHGGVRRRGELSFIQRSDALAPAASGLRPVVPGKPAESELIRRIRSDDPHERMPADGGQLSPHELETLRLWIAQGAVWPRHWSFEPIRRPLPPAVERADWPRQPIDRFVLASLDAAAIEPSPEADRYTLIRRLHLDLLGLPPRVEDIESFVADESPEPYERLVDRLLASPQFGERWGRHWLDVARYADTDGYEVDGARPNAWFWRDWVIRAVNEDLSFDQFTIEQLAGDLLPGATADQHLATAFHRQTLTNKEGGADPEEFRVEAVIDRVNTTSTVWLGLTAECAQCHDHPYDPLRQREFYGLFAFFNNADESQYRLPSPEDAEYQRKKAEHERKLSELRDRLDATPESDRSELKRQIERLERRAPKDPAIQLDVLAERSEPRVTYVLERGNFLEPMTDQPVETGGIAVLHRFEPRRENAPADRLDLARWLVHPSNPLTARVAANDAWQHLFGEGLVRTPDDFGITGEPPTHPALLDWLASEYMGAARKARGSESGREDRRGKVQDAAAKHEAQSTKHQSWSRKRLIRSIVTSAAYRQSSAHRPELAEIDPQNRLLHRQNRVRVEAEIVRDLHLAAGGVLARKIGGPSVFPPFPEELAQLDFRSDLDWKTSTGLDRYRRGMYTFFKRTLPHPNLTAFDCPMADRTSVRRGTSNTPLQALVTLNNGVFVEAAQALARRVLHAGCADDRERIVLAFRICLARLPTEWETARLVELAEQYRAWYEQHPEQAQDAAGPGTDDLEPVETAVWTAVASTILNLDEFITRE